PTQAVIIPVSQNFINYSEQIVKDLKDKNIRVELDDRNEKVGYKIRDWELKKIPYMLILGEKEELSENISVRQHRKGDLGSFALSDFIDKITIEIKNKDYTIN
ncbi:MAG: threonine--tRNA ligase, partial [Ignavibacteria bacterium]|nr:threonine--tRNA ligase [Ignavibacteria bacterium]